jgi:hypothetical protein
VRPVGPIRPLTSVIASTNGPVPVLAQTQTAIPAVGIHAEHLAGLKSHAESGRRQPGAGFGAAPHGSQVEGAAALDAAPLVPPSLYQ